MALAAPARGRADADAGAVARPRARRHESIRARSCSPATAGHRRGDRRVHRRSERRVSGAAAGARRCHARPPRRRAGDRRPGRPARSEAVAGNPRSRRRGRRRRHHASSASSTRRRAASPSARSASSRRRLGRRLPPSRTATTPLPGAGIADHEALAIETARALRAATFRCRSSGISSASTPRRRRRSSADARARRSARAARSRRRHHRRRGRCTSFATKPALRLADIVVRRTGLGVGRSRRPAAALRRANAAHDRGANELGMRTQRANSSEEIAGRRSALLRDHGNRESLEHPGHARGEADARVA